MPSTSAGSPRSNGCRGCKARPARTDRRATRYSAIRPRRKPIRTASVRLLAPSLPSTAPTWNFTVWSLMPRRRAIVLFGSPSASSASTSRSRGVSSSVGPSAPVSPPGRTSPPPSSRPRNAGCTATSPARTACTAAASSAASLSAGKKARGRADILASRRASGGPSTTSAGASSPAGCAPTAPAGSATITTSVSKLSASSARLRASATTVIAGALSSSTRNPARVAGYGETTATGTGSKPGEERGGSSGTLAERRHEVTALPSAQNRQRCLAARGRGRQQPLQIAGTRHRLACEAYENIADHHPGPFGRSATLDADEQQAAALAVQLRRERLVKRDRLGRDPEKPPFHLTVFEVRPHHALHNADRQRDARVTPRARGVDPHQPPRGIDQRPTREARIQRDIGVDDLVDPAATSRLQRPAHGVDQPERRADACCPADGEHQAANARQWPLGQRRRQRHCRT